MTKHWSRTELDYLERMAGNVPRQALLKAYNCWAGSAGKPLRTFGAIESKLSRAKVSTKAEGDTVTVSLIAETLGINPTSVRKWCQQGLLAASHCGAWWYIRRRDLVAFAKARPDLFCRFPVPKLVVLLENRPLAERIAASGCRPRGLGRRTVLIETGRVFRSAGEAARTVGVRSTDVRCGIRYGYAVGGYHWRWYDSQATPPQTNG
jgi:hypothetical protein